MNQTKDVVIFCRIPAILTLCSLLLLTFLPVATFTGCTGEKAEVKETPVTQGSQEKLNEGLPPGVKEQSPTTGIQIKH